MTSNEFVIQDPRLLRGTGSDFGPLVRRFPRERRTLIEVLDLQARERPHQDWLVFDGVHHLTFFNAREESRRVAVALSHRGLIAPRVAMLLTNQWEFMPLFLGTQIARGVAVPMHPDLRGPLLETLLKRCDPHVLVVRSDLMERVDELESLEGIRLIVVCGRSPRFSSSKGVPVVSYESLIEGMPASTPEELPKPSDLAALMFTSGTSGGSKAVMWSHNYQYLASAGVSDSLGHRPEDILSTPIQMCHMAGLQVIANSALQVGCTAHLKSEFSSSRWWDQIAEDRATFCLLMGPMLSMILASTSDAPANSLGYAYVIPPPKDRVEFEERFGTKVIWQAWGMTEIFPHFPTKTRIETTSDDPIGLAPRWVDYGIVDEDDQLLGPGALGEMVYRPLEPFSMASGYFGDPVATASAYRNFMFHSGDVGYYDEDFAVHIVSRNQDFVRRRGESVSVVELETIARNHPDVRDAIAYGVLDHVGEHEVKLDVILRRAISLDLLHAWLVDQLPRYMVPRFIEARTDFPRGLNQVVEKYQLAKEPLDRDSVKEYLPAKRKSKN